MSKRKTAHLTLNIEPDAKKQRGVRVTFGPDNSVKSIDPATTHTTSDVLLWVSDNCTDEELIEALTLLLWRVELGRFREHRVDSTPHNK